MTKAEAIRTQVRDLDAQGQDTDEIAAALGIPATRKPPWRRRRSIEDAVNLACQVRDIDPIVCHQMLLLWDQDRVVQTLLAAAAMIDLDRPESELLMWDRRALRGACKRGHPRTPRTTRIDPNGSLRCRVCERQRRAQLRRGAKRQRVRRVAA